MTPEGMIRVTDDAPAPAPAPAAAAPPPVAEAPQADTVADILRDMHSEISALPDPAAQPAPEAAPAPAPAPAPETPPTPPVETAPPPAEPELVVPAPETRIAEIFDLGQDEASATRAAEILSQFRYDDPVGYDNLVHGVYFSDEKRIRNFALERLGIDPGQVEAIKNWLAAGQPPPVQESLPAFPQPDADGIAWVEGVRLDTNIPAEKLAYENAKKLYDIDVREAGRAAQEQTAAAERQAAEAKQVQAFHDECYEFAANSYMEGPMNLVKSVVDRVTANLAPEDAILGKMFRSHVEQDMLNGEEIEKLGLKARENLVAVVRDTISRGQRAGYTPTQIKEACKARIKEGRMANFYASTMNLLRSKLDTASKEFADLVVRRNRAEIAATATAPVIPPGVQPVESVTPPLDNGQPQSLNEILAEVRQIDRQRAAALNQ